VRAAARRRSGSRTLAREWSEPEERPRGLPDAGVATAAVPDPRSHRHALPATLGESEARPQRESERLLALHRASTGLAAQTAEPDTVLDEVLRSATALLGAGGASLYRWDRRAELLRCVRSWQVPAGDTTPDVRHGEGLAGQTFAQGRPVVVNDYPSWEFAMRSGREGGLRAGLGVPLRHGGRPIGVLLIRSYRHEAPPFTDDDARLVTLFADQAAIAIENARVLEQEQERRLQLEAIRDVTVELTRELDLPVVLRLVIERAAELVGAVTGVVRLWDEEGQVLVPHAWHGRDESVATLRVKLGDGVTGIVGQRREGMIVNDYRNSPYAHSDYVEHGGPLAILAEPILYQDRLVGVITVSNEGAGRPFTEQDRQLLGIFADQAAIAIENARLYREVAERERRLRDLIGRLLVTQEEERRRVAYDIHDGLAQVAAAAQQHLEAFASHYRPRSPQTRQELGRTLQLAQRTVREARRVIADLRPTVLDDLGLATAIRMELDTLSTEGWGITYQEVLGRERLPSVIETALFRVVQEALTNVRKHAETTHVHVALRRRGQAARLEVRDWGRGFQPSAVLASAGRSERVGLAGMQERIAWLGGRCTVRSRPGAGTRIVAEVPLPGPERAPTQAAHSARPSGGGMAHAD
jgi:signal transduction histidine kinase